MFEMHSQQAVLAHSVSKGSNFTQILWDDLVSTGDIHMDMEPGEWGSSVNRNGFHRTVIQKSYLTLFFNASFILNQSF